MNVLLISTYELGRQPFGLASPAAWLSREGADVRCLDLAVEPLDEDAVRAADLVALYVPMHTATRIAARVMPRVRELNRGAHVCFYGLYATMNEPYLRSLGGDSVIGGEFEEGLVALARRLRLGRGAAEEVPAERGVSQLLPPSVVGRPNGPAGVSLNRQRFVTPERTGLPSLERYARLDAGDGRLRLVGYTEASRGCKHLCRHCPIPPVYGGRFRVVQRDVVLEDVRRQVAAGAEHVTFGDPDFFNGVGHARAIVQTVHEEFPSLTYDVTIKVEHLLRHARELPLLARTGCLFVTTAVESVDDDVLARLDKGHTRSDFVEVVRLFRDAALVLHPTFVAFTPWTTPVGYLDLLDALDELDLVENVSPIQLAIRLLIPAGSLLLELTDVRELVGPFDAAALVHPWSHPDPIVDRLQERAQVAVREMEGASRRETFERLHALARAAAGVEYAEVTAGAPAFTAAIAGVSDAPTRAAIPYLTEPWYC